MKFEALQLCLLEGQQLWNRQVGKALVLLALITGLVRAQPAPQSPDKIEPLKSSITVTESVTTETPAAVAVFTSKQIEENPGVNIDDRLRTLPGFSLFRRSSSVVANPTTQGISLRGLGSSGASRTLVLWDGIPANDPFGGWVYWTRFAPESLDRAEISRGASTSVFGDRALSGAISLFTKPAERWKMLGSYEGGNRNTHQLSTGFSHLMQQWAFSTNARALTTDGYYIVPQYKRGTADTPAGVRFVAMDTRADWLQSAKSRLFLKFDMLAEQRANGTALVSNSTGAGEIAAHYHREIGSDSLTVLAYHQRAQYHASFSTVAANRNSERITSWQRVPAEATGGAAMYGVTRTQWNALLGGDFQRVEGQSKDILVPTGERIGGGVQFQRGGFAQTDFKAGSLRLFGGTRVHSTGINTFLNPSGGLTYGKKNWRARGSVYKSFRAPTLNELYREFRAGNTTTLPNALLKPESAFGAELGADYSGELGRLSVTAFRTEINQIITNVTLLTSPTLIQRQRQNAASALNRGVEATWSYNWKALRSEASYLYADGRFANGFRLPQVPKSQGSATLTWTHKRGMLSAGLRSFALQFEDEINLYRLPGYATIHTTVRYQLTSSVSAMLAIENILDRQYVVGFNPTPLIGAPLLWRGGLRWDGKVKK